MAHTFTNLWYHVVFGTKGRSPTIDSDVRASLHAYIGGIVRELGGTALSINGTADHVHALIKLPATIALADAVRVIKTNSSRWAHDAHGRRDLVWQSGYSAFSVSESGVTSVRAYIERQEEHHHVTTFQEEYFALLRRHGIAYDPKYLFE